MTALRRIDKDKFGHAIWECRCDCGNIHNYKSYNLYRNKYPTCGCSRSTLYTQHPNFKGYKEISGTYIKSLKRGAKDRNLEYNLDKEYIWYLYEKQNRKCALSGVDIIFAKSTSQMHLGKATASLDRIDSKKGYVQNNVRWVHKDVNRIRWAFSDMQFFSWIKLMYEYNKLGSKND